MLENDFIVSELLSEQKNENKRKTRLLTISIIVNFLIVAAFLLYLNMYDFTSVASTTTEATGVYTLVDSAGNMVSSDITPEMLEVIMNGFNNKGD